jgi:hypothetical protein
MKRAWLLVFVLAACDSPTDHATAVDMQGEWTYHATQTTPVLDMAGALIISDQQGASFTGTAQLTETDVQGTQRTRLAVLSGRVVGGDVVDMDLYVDTQVRRHVARLVADSMSGTWSVTGATIASGTFTARRVP